MQSLSTVPYGTYYIIIRIYRTSIILYPRYSFVNVIKNNKWCTYIRAFVYTLLTNIPKNIDLEMGSTSYVRTYESRYIYSDDIETKENCNYGTSCMYVGMITYRRSEKNQKSDKTEIYVLTGVYICT